MARRGRGQGRGMQEEEIVDLGTLPPWTPFAFKLYFHPYIDEETQENLQQLLTDNLKHTIITRADLEQYARDFGYVAPPGAEENESAGQQENPKLWAKVFGKKMFYTDVAGMRVKQTRLEAEEDKSENEEFERDDATDNPDCTYQIDGFPRDREEMEHALQAQTSYQLALYIRPSDLIIERQTAEEQKENPTHQKPDDLSQDYIDLTDEIRTTHRNSPWRNCVTRVYNYKEHLESTEEALNGILDIIMHTSERYMEYMKWLKSTTVTPLCPLQPPEFQEHDPNLSSSQVSLTSAANQKPAQQKSQKQFSVAPGSTNRTSDRPDDIMSHFQSHSLEPEQIDEIPSADDDAIDWNFDTYYKKINAVGDQSASPGVILKCMMQQLTNEGASNNKLDIDVENILAQHLEVKNSEKQLKSAQVSQTDSIDYTNLVGRRHIKNPTFAEEELKLLRTQQVPGVNRYLMPKRPQLSLKNRKIRAATWLAYVTMPIWDLNQAMELTHFEQLLDGVYNFSDRIYKERFRTQELIQVLSAAIITEPTIAAHYDETADQLYVAIHYETPVERYGQLEWTEDSRARPSFQVWEPDQDYDTNFLDVDEHSIGALNETTNMVFGFDHSVYKHFTYSVGRETFDAELQPVIKQRNYAVKDGIVFGFHTDGAFWVRFLDSSRAMVQIEEDEISFTITGKDGLVVKQYFSGPVQQYPCQVKQGAFAEISRTITGGGTVIKNIANGSQILLFVNGNYSVHKADGSWVSTNNRGRNVFRTPSNRWVPIHTTSENESVPHSNVTDPKTKIQTMLREDSTMKVTYPDGSINTIFGDSTCMHQYPGGKLLIESSSYAPIEIEKKNTTTCMADGSVLYLNSDHVKYVRPDGFEMILKSDKTVHLKNNPNASTTTADLVKQVIWNKSKEGHYFELSQTGVDAQLASTPAENDVKTLVTPRLFLVNNKNEGHELLNPQQLGEFTQFFGDANFTNDSDVVTDKNQLGGRDRLTPSPTPPATEENEDKKGIEYEVLTWVKEIAETELTQGHIPKSPLINFAVPDIVRPFQQVHPPTLHEFGSHTIYRSIIKNPDFTEHRRKAFNTEIENFEKWKKLQAARTAEFGTMTKLKQETLKIEFGIQEKIINLRRQPEQYKPTEEFKKSVTKVLKDIRSTQQSSADEYVEELEQSNKPVSAASSLPKTPGFGGNKRPKRVRYPSDADYNQKNYFETPEGLNFIQNSSPLTIKTEPAVYELTEVNPNDLPETARSAYDSIQQSFSRSTVGKGNTTINTSLESPKFDASFLTPIASLQSQPTPRRKKMYSPRTVKLQPVDTPSVFQNVDRLEKIKQETEIAEAEEYLQKKTMNFTYDGKPRRRIVKPRSIRRSNVSCEPNPVYVLNESITDRRGRTSSMANSPTHRAPSINAVRRDGTHTIVEKAWRKKWSPKQLREHQQSMMAAVTTDRHARNLLVTPGEVNFGTVKEGGNYEIVVTMKNEDSQMMRISIRQPRDTSVKVQFSPKPLAMGMELKLHVELTASPCGTIDSSFTINAKSQKYHLPITAVIISEEAWNEYSSNQADVGKTPMRRTVRQVPGNSGHKYLRRLSDKSSVPSLPDITTPRNSSQISVESTNVVEEQMRARNSSKPSNPSYQSNEEDSDVDN